jgi:uncharacterized protein (TIGR02598 family)
MNPQPALFCFRNPNFEIQISDSPPTFPPSHLITPLTPAPPNPFIPRRPPVAFSLTEVVIALGIFAVSMVGVLALFPVASSTGQESSEETQAAILAQMIFDEIRDSADIRNAGNAYTLAGPNTVRTIHWQPVTLTNRTNYQVAYDVKRRDNTASATDGPGMMGDPIALKALFTNVTTNAFSNGLAGANYLAQLQVFPLDQRARLAQLTLRIDTPGNLPATNRRSFYFTTRVSGR